MGVLADLAVLVRWGDESFGLTGWGWVAFIILTGAVSDIGRRS